MTTLKCPYCGTGNTIPTAKRKGAHTCRECKRQFRHFPGDETAILLLDKIPLLFSRETAAKEKVAVYLPSEVLTRMNKRISGKATGRSIARSPFIVAAVVMLMGIMWDSDLAEAVEMLKSLSKNRVATAETLRRIADELSE